MCNDRKSSSTSEPHTCNSQLAADRTDIVTPQRRKLGAGSFKTLTTASISSILVPSQAPLPLAILASIDRISIIPSTTPSVNVSQTPVTQALPTDVESQPLTSSFRSFSETPHSMTDSYRPSLARGTITVTKILSFATTERPLLSEVRLTRLTLFTQASPSTTVLSLSRHFTLSPPKQSAGSLNLPVAKLDSSASSKSLTILDLYSVSATIAPKLTASTTQETSLRPVLRISPVSLASIGRNGKSILASSASARPSLLSAGAVQSSDHSLTPTIIGAIVGSAIALVALFILGFYLIRLRRSGVTHSNDDLRSPLQDSKPAYDWPLRTPVSYAYWERPSEAQIRTRVLGTALLTDPFVSLQNAAPAALQQPPRVLTRSLLSPLATSPFLQQLNVLPIQSQPSLRPPDTTPPPLYLAPPPRNPRRLLFPEASRHKWKEKRLLTPNSTKMYSEMPAAVRMSPSTSSMSRRSSWRTSPARYSRRSDPFDLEGL